MAHSDRRQSRAGWNIHYCRSLLIRGHRQVVSVLLVNWQQFQTAQLQKSSSSQFSWEVYETSHNFRKILSTWTVDSRHLSMCSEQFHVKFLFLSYEWWCHCDQVTDISPWRASLSSWYSPAFSAALRSWTPRSQGVAQETACLWTNSLSDSLPELWWGINIDFSIYLSTKLIYVSFIRTTGNQESDILLSATEEYNILKEKHFQVPT